MEFVTGVRKKETLELSKVLAPESLDQEVLTDGSIYSIRNMGEIAFVILRKRDGLLQTVWEEGKTNLSISELKEGDCIRVKGTVRAEESAPRKKKSVRRRSRFSPLRQSPFPLPLINGSSTLLWRPS